MAKVVEHTSQLTEEDQQAYAAFFKRDVEEGSAEEGAGAGNTE